ncbi:MAG: Hpt domain-containing protein [Cyanobacteria bacterium P01_A01_bin.137]
MMIANQVVPQQASADFLQEASDLIQQIDNEISTLGQNFSPQKAHTLMRLAHTLKGAAAIVGLDAINTTAQTLENAFKALCVPETSLTSVVEGLIFDGYACLKLLLSAQLTKAPVDEGKVLDRMAPIVAQLQDNLGARFGQNSYLPSSAQLGVDVTQSIFEGGVTEYLDELETALTVPEPQALTALLKTQAEVFMGLAESLRLPGFGRIAQATLTALQRHPNQVVKIAQLALVDYRAGQADVLQGDRTQGGAPSAVLNRLGDSRSPQPISWFSTLWQWLNQPIFRSGHKSQASVSQGGRETVGETALTVEMQPLNTVFQHCYHDLDRLINQRRKPVLVEFKDSEMLIEQTVAPTLYQTLSYLVCHAFIHGIEPSPIRRRRGKSAVGKIQLAAREAGPCLVICVWDDGCGPSPEPAQQRIRPYIDTMHGTSTAVHRSGKGTCFTLKIPT